MQGKRNNTFREIWRELKKSGKILMTMHPRPDGDSFGSCTAMKYVLEKMGKSVKLVSKDKVNEGLEFYDFNKEVEYGADIQSLELDEFDCILFLDYGSLEDYPEEFKEKLKNKKIINIDHHETNSSYGTLNYVDKKAPSCCSILYEFFENRGVRFDRELSLRLMVGLCTDTAFFIHGNSLDSFKKALVLLEKGGINYKKDLYDPIMNNPWKLKKLHGLLLANMVKKEINGKTVAYSWVTKKEYEKQKLNEADIRLGISCMQNIKDLNLIFTLVQLNGDIKGSFRSLNLDTTIYSTALGGGGHKLASGFILKTHDMKAAIQKVLRTIEEKGFVEIGN
ncbi:MAG: DHH family phosphoesterase [Candidatus Nanoarchaeia archaeon]|nr:DHH family phosphoesterase [Candidatus Nanoarchaeia archaeon]